MSAGAYFLRIGGYPATEIAAHTPPTWETHADGGMGEMSWAFALTSRSQHQALRVGALVELICCGVPVYRGTLAEPDRTTWECTAKGLSASLRTYLALDSGANATRDVGTAVATAITDGWKGHNFANVSGVASGDTSNGPVKVGQLLDEYAAQVGSRWGTDAFGNLYMRTPPTEPMWSASPDAAAFGTTDEDQAGRLAGRFLNSATSLYETAFAGTPGPAEAVDLTSQGAMTLAQAQAILAGMLPDASAHRWTNGVTLGRDQVQTIAGSSAFLAGITAGQMVRTFGLPYAVTADKLFLDVEIGKTRYTAGEDTIYIEPVNTAPRTFGDVIAAA